MSATTVLTLNAACVPVTRKLDAIGYDPTAAPLLNEAGELLSEELQNIHKELGIFKEVRGRGLMIGAELIDAHAGKAGDVSEAARKAGVLVLQAGPNVSRFLPPLTITNDELKDGMLRFRNGLAAFLEK